MVNKYLRYNFSQQIHVPGSSRAVREYKGEGVPRNDVGVQLDERMRTQRQESSAVDENFAFQLAPLLLKAGTAIRSAAGAVKASKAAGAVKTAATAAKNSKAVKTGISGAKKAYGGAKTVANKPVVKNALKVGGHVTNAAGTGMTVLAVKGYADEKIDAKRQAKLQK